MSGSVIRVLAEWAYWGRTPREHAGYHVLACSRGQFSERNFSDILDRFSPGTLEALPQVTVSYVLAEDGRRYLGTAFHEPAIGGIDRFGRDVTFTRYFCLPYEEVAAGAISYLAMHDTLKDHLLPEASTAPVEVELARGEPGIPGDAARALEVAELLLTGNPVCIVGAGETTARDRLAFIDAVMLLLPYGLRAEMTAATWTSPVYRGHKFRLFFSDAPRKQPDTGPGDHLVAWRPDRLEVRAAVNPRINPGYAAEYQEWLTPLLEQSVTAKLAARVEPASFKAADILKMVEVTTKSAQRGWLRRSRHLSAADSPHPVERMIGRLDGDLRSGSTSSVETTLSQIQDQLTRRAPNEAERQRNQALLKEGRLLREDLPLGKRKGYFYRSLLTAAFGSAISYPDYLLIEDMLAGEPLHGPLLHAIEADCQDLRVLFLARFQLSGNRYPRALMHPEQIINVAADPALRADHAELIWAAMLEVLRNLRPAERNQARTALRSRGFLAPELRQRAPLDLPFQAAALTSLLEALYGRVDERYFQELFTGYQHAPTEALLLAACQFITEDHLPYVLYYFLDGVARAPNLGQQIRDGMRRLGYGAPDDAPVPAARADAAVRADPEPESAVSQTPIDVPVTRSTTVDYLTPPKPADPLRLRRRVLNPSGDFTQAEGKHQRGDER
jgi:hypothetical protein